MTTKRETARRHDLYATLHGLGFSTAEIDALRRISNRLHRWHEAECGDSIGGIERDEETGECFRYVSRTGKRYPTADLETPALKRLAAIMARHEHLASYVQGDPRGAALYILRPADVPPGEDVSAYYTRGICVY